MSQIELHYALRDEKVNIWSMTYGCLPTKYSHQTILCKKKPFADNRLGPYLLDCKKSAAKYSLSNIGEQYLKGITDVTFELCYIALIEDQIKIIPTIELFHRLENEGLFSIWNPNAPYEYFTDCDEGYLILFRVYRIPFEVTEKLLEKGRSGRNYYYSLTSSVQYTNAQPVLSDEYFNKIKAQLYSAVYEPTSNVNENNLIVEELTKEVDSLTGPNEITDTEKLTIIKTRVGHGALKKKLLQKECRCKICGLSDERFLIASHIKPWSQSNAQERLDLDNVLLLCPQHDAVFDKGYISFDEDGTLIVSSELSLENRALLNLMEGKKVAMSDGNRKYLKWHRANLFIEL